MKIYSKLDREIYMEDRIIVNNELQERVHNLGLVHYPFGEAVAQLRLALDVLQTKQYVQNMQVLGDSFSNKTLLSKTSVLLPSLVQSAILLRMGLRKKQQETKETTKERQATITPREIEQELINVITSLIALIEQLKKSAYTSLLQPLKVICDTYQQDLNCWQQANLEERELLLMPKALIAGVDLAGIYSFDHNLALTSICRNAYGFIEKLNNYGNHPVAVLGGIHFKPNPEGRDFISPGMEYSVYLIHSLLSKQTLVAPSTLLKIYQVSIEKIDRKLSIPSAYTKLESARVAGKSIKELLSEQPELSKELIFQPAEINKVVQAGQTIEGISLVQLLELLQRFDWLDQKLGKVALIENLAELISGAYLDSFLQSYPRYHLLMSVKELTEAYLALMATCAFAERLKNFRDLEVSFEKSLNVFQNASKGVSNKNILSLLALLTKWPQLMVNEDLANLLHMVELLAIVPILLPQSSPEQIYETLPHFMDRLDSYNFSAQFVANLLLNPYDGKADNYMVTLEKNATGEVIRWHIIGIDNDKVLGPAIIQAKKNGPHYPGMKFIFGCMPHVNMPLNETFRQEFLAISPECLLLNWLADIYQQNLRYQQLIDSGILTEEDIFDKDSGVAAIDIPIKFDRVTVPEIYRKLCLLQQYVRTNTVVTHQNLFEQVNLIMAIFYQKVVEKKKYPLSAMTYLYQGDDTTHAASLEAELANELDTTMVPTPSGNKVMRAVLQHETQSEIDFELERVHEVETITKDFILTLNLSDHIAEPEQLFTILQPVAEHMDFIHALPLTVSQLNQLLHLSVQKNKAKLTALFIRCGADVNHRYSQNTTILHMATCKEDVDFHLVEELLRAPRRQQNLYNQQGETPLFLINLKNEYLVKLLLKYGEDIDFVNPFTKMSLILKTAVGI